MSAAEKLQPAIEGVRFAEQWADPTILAEAVVNGPGVEIDMNEGLHKALVDANNSGDLYEIGRLLQHHINEFIQECQ